jgi:FG-GAP-like repeat/PASTA domain
MWPVLAVAVLPIVVGQAGCDIAKDPNTVSVLRNRGDGSFEARLNYGTGRGPASVAIADLNGDGKPDLVTANFSANTVSVFLADTAGVCVVPNVKGKGLAAAKAGITGAQCRVAKIRRAYSKNVRKRHVISQAPPSRRVLPTGGKVNLVVSRGRRKR